MDALELEKIRFTLELQFREQLVRRPEFTFFQSIGLKDIFQTFRNTDGTFLGTIHLKWNSGKTWTREGWIDSEEESEVLIRKTYQDKPFSTEKLLMIHHMKEVNRQERIRAEHEMEFLLENGKMLWN
jgi:hypothetical protein